MPAPQQDQGEGENESTDGEESEQQTEDKMNLARRSAPVKGSSSQADWDDDL